MSLDNLANLFLQTVKQFAPSQEVNTNTITKLFRSYVASEPIVDTDTDFVLEVNVAGLPRDSLQISLKNYDLVITGKYNDRDVNFSRRLPLNIDQDSCRAMYSNGLLRISFVKNSNQEPRIIPISQVV